MTAALPSPLEVSYDFVLPEIAQGSRPPAGRWLRERGFRAVAFCAFEFQPDARLYHGVEIIRADLDDSGHPMTMTEWRDARRASFEVALLAGTGTPVYVSCHMGKNRSGLVTALAVHRLTGMSGRRAVELVRARREGALSNAYFAAALESIPGKHQPKRVADAYARLAAMRR